jgi:hypothetical protein
MATLVICTNTRCIHSKARKDGAYQCGCTTIGINLKNECDTYMVLYSSDKCHKCGGEYITDGVHSNEYCKKCFTSKQ